jgi:hypothetical protein
MPMTVPSGNPYLPEPMRLIRRYPLTDDVHFFQVRPEIGRAHV